MDKSFKIILRISLADIKEYVYNWREIRYFTIQSGHIIREFHARPAVKDCIDPSSIEFIRLHQPVTLTIAFSIAPR